MLKLRLSMGGTKKRPVYKIVVADSRFARDGRFIEKLGFYNPLLPKEKEERIGLEIDRIKYWMSQGAKPTTRVARILGEKQIIPMPANSNNPQSERKCTERSRQAALRGEESGCQSTLRQTQSHMEQRSQKTWSRTGKRLQRAEAERGQLLANRQGSSEACSG